MPWRAGARSFRLGRPAHFGLNAAQVPPLGLVSVIDLAMCSSTYLGECWHRGVRFANLAIDCAGPRLDDGGDPVFLRFRPPVSDDAIPRHAVEFALASYLVVGRRATGAPIVPRAVRFRHGRPRDVSAHERLFGVPVSFGHACSEIELDPAVLQLPLRDADPAMSKLMERYAEEWLARLGVQTSLVDQISRHIYAELGSGVPSAEAIARRLGLSERSLSRRLRAEGLPYPEVVDSVRRELALVYLRNRSLKMAEVAFLLGFSELSAFYRAFRRWHGKTPLQVRGVTVRE
jgi:AraC-like DNA-binding protein